MMTGFLTGLLRSARNDMERRAGTFDQVYVEVKQANLAAANGISVTPESSLQMGAVFAAVGLLADTIGMLPLILYEKKSDYRRRRAEEHYLYPILHDAPNPMMTAVEFRSTMQGYLALRGNAICQVDYDEGGRVESLWPLRWENVQELRVDKENGMLRYYYLLPDGKMQWLDSSRVWHLRGWGSDGVVGYSPITLARRTVELGLSAEEFGVRFFKNDARPGIILEHPGKLSNEAHKNLKDSVEEEHKGVSKSHRMMILEEGLKLHEVGIPPEEAQFLQTRQFSITEIARFFRVPPHMIGDLSRATFSNIEHQGIEFVQYSLQSWFTRWEQSIKRNLLVEEERKRYYAEHLVDALLRGDTLSRYQSYQSGIQAGWFTRADAREKENLEPIAGLEEPLVPMNMVALGEEALTPNPSPGGRGEEPTPPAPEPQEQNPEPPNPEPPRHQGHQEEQREEQEAEEIRAEMDRNEALDLEREERRTRVALGRHRLMRSYHRIFEDTAKRILRREVQDVKAAGQRYLKDLNQNPEPRRLQEHGEEQRGKESFNAWMRQFYDQHKEWMWRQLKPVYDSYGDLVTDAAEAEVGNEKQVEASKRENFVNAYVASYTGRHAGTSENKIRKALTPSPSPEGGGEKDLLAALETELDGWVDERGTQIANEESVRSNNAMAVAVYEMLGVTQLMSVAFGKNCPYCDDLDGKIIGIQENYIEGGKDFQPKGAEKPLTSVDNLRHAPYHGGCDCMTVSA